jgi:hypothetical protein
MMRRPRVMETASASIEHHGPGAVGFDRRPQAAGTGVAEMGDAQHRSAAPAEGEPARAFRSRKGEGGLEDLRGRRVCSGRHENRRYGQASEDATSKRACENTEHQVRFIIATGVTTSFAQI